MYSVLTAVDLHFRFSQLAKIGHDDPNWEPPKFKPEDFPGLDFHQQNNQLGSVVIYVLGRKAHADEIEVSIPYWAAHTFMLSRVMVNPRIMLTDKALFISVMEKVIEVMEISLKIDSQTKF